MVRARCNWQELTAVEVLVQLERLSQAGEPATSGFLDIHQWLPLQIQHGLIAAGGHSAAQFRCVSLSGEPPALTCLRIPAALVPLNTRKPRGLRRWLEQAGIPASEIGDIALTATGDLVVVALPDVGAELPAGINQQLAAWPAASECTLERATAASNRLDSVVAAVSRVSRSEAQVAIRQGFIYRNWQPALKQTVEVAPGDQLVFRTQGRFAIAELSSQQRSGRTTASFTAFPC